MKGFFSPQRGMKGRCGSRWDVPGEVRVSPLPSCPWERRDAALMWSCGIRAGVWPPGSGADRCPGFIPAAGPEKILSGSPNLCLPFKPWRGAKNCFALQSRGWRAGGKGFPCFLSRSKPGLGLQHHVLPVLNFSSKDERERRQQIDGKLH